MRRQAIRFALMLLSVPCLAKIAAEDLATNEAILSSAEQPKFAELIESSNHSDATVSGSEPQGRPSTNLAPLDEIAELKKRLEDLEKSAQASQRNDTWQNSQILEQANEPAGIPEDKWDIRLGGHVQLDYVDWANADPMIDDTSNYFNYRRLRLVAEGVGYEQFDFRLQMTLEPGLGSTDNISASPDVKDAYLSMNEIPILGRLRVGNFFVPFCLEQVTNDTNNVFLERSIPTEGIFAASREVGLAIYNCTDDQRVTWSGGVFFEDINDTDKTRFDDNQGTRLSGRLTWLPYYDSDSNGRSMIHTGMGVLHTHSHNDSVRFRSRPQVQRGPVLIDSGILNADSYTTGNLELAIVYESLTIQTEVFVSEVQHLVGDPTQISGMYAHASYFLTGENRIFEPFGQHGAQFGRNHPHRNFKFSQAGASPGAWELKARWSNLDLRNIERGQYNDLTTGVNWYWSDRTRWMFDWIHPVTTQDAVFGETKSDLLALRLDFNW
jgi:phosphate-selective porin OprO and OprP